MPRKKNTPEESWSRARANGYRAGAHEARDSLTGLNKHIRAVVNHHDRVLDLYVVWWKGKIEEEEKRVDLTLASVKDRVLCKDAPAPRMVDVKDFVRFYYLQSKGRIGNNKYASTKSIVSAMEFFFAGFTRVTGTPTVEQERSEIFWWIRYVLTAEGEVVDECLPKHNFTKEDLDEILLTLWTSKDLIYISERDKVEFTLLLHTYCWTGARLSAFFSGEGLRYKDIHLVQRRRGNGYEYIWKIDQRWVKNNRNPNTVAFGAAGKEHGRLLYNDGALLIPLAFADGALFGFDSLDGLWQQEIPTGETEVDLRWNDSALETKIVRMSKSKFLRIFKSTLANAGYPCAASVHQIRRCLGKKVDERYTEVERSQHILQSDPRVFGQSYVANCSSVDGQAAFLNEEADHTVIDYFQGLRRFRERGLPNALPAAMEDDLEKHPEVVKLREKETTAGDGGGRNDAKKAQGLLASLKRKALVSYREAWIRQRRDWKILTRGKISPEVDSDGNHLNLILPERSRIEKKMRSTKPLDTDQMREAIQDVYTLISRDYTVFYRPGEEPLDGLCPVCGKDMETSYPKSKKRFRSDHIHTCRRKERAKQLDRTPSSLEYCFDCTEWYVRGPQWDEHCQQHLSQLSSKSCGSITYCNTLIRPAFCPYCLGEDKSPSLRMQSWDRDADVLAHMEKEHNTASCLHPLCQGVALEDRQSFYYHQGDAHGFRRASKALRKRKREDMDTKQRREEEGPCTDSRDYSLPSPKKPKWDDGPARSLSAANCRENIDDKDSFNLVNSDESLDDFISQCVAFPASPSPSVNGDAADHPAMTECKETPEANATNSSVVETGSVEFPPSPRPSVNGDEAHLDNLFAMTGCKAATDANANKTSSGIVDLDSHVEKRKVRIKLSYKRPKIILRVGQASNRHQQPEKRHGRYSRRT